MANPFQKTLRSLESDSMGTRTLLLLVSAAALLGVVAWGVLARVPVYKSSSLGRFEAVQAVHRIELPVSGRVVRSYLRLDGDVKEGDLLLELDASEKRIDLANDESKLTTLSEQLTLTREQIDGQRKESDATARAEAAALREAHERLDELEPQQELADMRDRRAKESPAGALSTIERLQRGAEAEGLRRSARTQVAAMQRLAQDQIAKQRARENRLREARAEEVRLQGEIAALKATLERVRYEIDLTKVRAPADGRLCDVVELTSGAFLDSGARVASIVEPGTLRVRAKFTTETVGVLRRGQRAQVKLPGYPWPLYGTVPAVVTRAGTESDTGQLSGGVVRVELAVEKPPDPRIDLTHGLQADVEVEIARVSPLALMLRALGEWRPDPAPEPTPPGARGPEVANASPNKP